MRVIHYSKITEPEGIVSFRTLLDYRLQKALWYTQICAFMIQHPLTLRQALSFKISVLFSWRLRQVSVSIHVISRRILLQCVAD